MKKVALELEKEKQKTDTLLKELLPASVAEQLRHGRQVEAGKIKKLFRIFFVIESYVTDSGEYPEATVLFADIVSFTVICSQCKPIEVVQLLNDLYSKFDRLTMFNEVFKV